MLHLVFGVIAGAIAGNIPSRFVPSLDIGWFGNAITGALGGLICERFVGALLSSGGNDPGSMLVSVMSGAAGGGILAALSSLTRSRQAR